MTLTTSCEQQTKASGITRLTMSRAFASCSLLRNENRKQITTALRPRFLKVAAASSTWSSASGVSTSPVGGRSRSSTTRRLRRLTSGFDCQGTSNCSEKLCGRLWRPMCRMSRKPRVVIMPDLGALALDHHIGGDRRAVQDHVDVAGRDARAPADLDNALNHANRLVRRRGRDLVHEDLLADPGCGLFKDDIRERPSDIHSNSDHLRPFSKFKRRASARPTAKTCPCSGGAAPPGSNKRPKCSTGPVRRRVQLHVLQAIRRRRPQARRRRGSALKTGKLEAVGHDGRHGRSVHDQRRSIAPPGEQNLRAGSIALRIFVSMALDQYGLGGADRGSDLHDMANLLD